MATATINRPKVTKIGKGAGSEASPSTPVGIFEIVKVSLQEFMSDNCLNLASAVAYNALLAIFPIILAGFTILSFVATQDNINQITNNVVSALGGTSSTTSSGDINIANIVHDQLPKFLLSVHQSGLLFGALTLVTTIWSAAGIFGALTYAINMAWNLVNKRNPVKQAAIQIMLLFVLGALLLLSFGVTAATSWIQSTAKDNPVTIFGFDPFNNLVTQLLFSILSWIIPIVVNIALFSILFKVLPDTKTNPWRAVIIGATVTGVLFEVVKIVFPIYLSISNAQSGYAKTYGSLGGVILFLFLVYIGAAIVLLGAEVNSTLVRGGAPKPVRVPAGETRQVGAVAVTPEGDEAIVQEARESGASDPSTTKDPGSLPRVVGGADAHPTPRPIEAVGPTRPAGLPDRIMAYVVLLGIFAGGILGALRGPGSKGAKKANSKKSNKKK